MKNYLFSIIFVLGLFGQAYAGTTAKDVLSDILQHDFAGDGAFRVGKVIYTDSRGRKVGDPCCSEPREVFDAVGSPIDLVTKWKIAGEGKVSQRDASYQVNFTVVAGTTGEGDTAAQSRKLEPFQIVEERLVEYHLKLSNGTWFLADPPRPKVSVFALIRILEDEIGRVQSIIANESGDAKAVAFHNRLIVRDKAQKAALEDIVKTLQLHEDTEVH